jgi:ribosomal protein S18 acetylase RimI-like enzyme
MASGSGEVVAERFPTAPADPPVRGLVIRRLRRPADYPAMNAIANAAREAMGDSFMTTDDQMREYYESATRFDVARDVAILELDGRIIGYVRGGRNDEGSGRHVYEIVPFLDPTVDPELIYPLMLGLMETHLRSLAAADPAREKVLGTFGGDSAPRLEALAVAAGFVPVRHGYSMVRPHVDDLPDSDLPEGLEIRPVRPEHLRPIWDAAVEAFRDAWGFVEPTEDDYQHYLTDRLDSQTDLWQIAWDGDEVAGQVRAFINEFENEQVGRKRGYTESISVRRPWRRRGLARALIGASIRQLRERGMTETALGVDTENVTGALRLYESCGYVPVARSSALEKPFD